MTPMQVTFYVYADTEEEVTALQHALNDFVRTQLNKGTVVTATKLANTVTRFRDNYLITNFLKNG